MCGFHLIVRLTSKKKISNITMEVVQKSICWRYREQLFIQALLVTPGCHKCEIEQSLYCNSYSDYERNSKTFIKLDFLHVLIL